MVPRRSIPADQTYLLLDALAGHALPLALLLLRGTGRRRRLWREATRPAHRRRRDRTRLGALQVHRLPDVDAELVDRRRARVDVRRRARRQPHQVLAWCPDGVQLRSGRLVHDRSDVAGSCDVHHAAIWW